KIKSAIENSSVLMMSGHSTRGRSVVFVGIRLPIFTLPKCGASFNARHAAYFDLSRMPNAGDPGQLRKKCIPEVRRARTRQCEAGERGDAKPSATASTR